MRTLALFASFCWVLSISAQNCTISVDDNVCLNELLSLSASSSAAASAYDWSFSDGTNSTGQSTSKTFSTVGPKYITLTVTLAGGGTCTVKDTVEVRPLPIADFDLGGSEFCFSKHEVCITDKSTMGASGIAYAQRIIVWGDGASETENSPVYGDQVCYSSYPNPDSFDVTIEVTSEFGCEDIHQESLEVLHEHLPSFTIERNLTDCDFQLVCFDNDSNRPDDIKRILWSYGNGVIDSTYWLGTCQPFYNSGIQNATFEVELDNGCILTSTSQFTTAFQVVEPDPEVQDSIVCFPDQFVVENTPIFFASYTWYMLNENGDTVDRDINRVADLDPPEPGTYFIYGRIRLGDCDTTSPPLQVESVGVKPAFQTLNQSLCRTYDTAYFINRSLEHESSRVSYLWRYLDDETGVKGCSSARFNCNLDTGSISSKHYFNRSACYITKLIAVDSVYGCADSAVDIVSRARMDSVYFEDIPGLRCAGYEEEFGIAIQSNLCLATILARRDTQCVQAYDTFGGAFWYPFNCDSSGWASPAFDVSWGDTRLYLSADTSDYIDDPNRTCRDTLYYDSMFRLTVQPGYPVFSKTSCIPETASWTYPYDDDSSISYVWSTWGDGSGLSSDTLYKDTFPTVQHIYDSAGVFALQIYVEDTNGCWAQRGLKFPPFLIKVGYFSDFKVDSVYCPGEAFTIYDSIYYWLDPTKHWRDTIGLEEIYWDFDDGRGFVTDTALPKYAYTEKGQYQIRMISIDRLSCVDTITKIVDVGGVTAGIKKADTAFLCDQIVQFFDSSESVLSGPLDTINRHWWDFGDGSTPSLLKNPFHYFNKNGYYTITHVVSNQKGCFDTARQVIYMRGPQVKFDIISDTVGCAPFTAEFNISGTNVSEFVLFLGDQGQSTISSSGDTTVSFTYSEPGVYDVFLYGSDSFFNSASGNYYTCTEVYPDTSQKPILLKRIVVLPRPEVDFDILDPLCVDVPIRMVSRSNSAYSLKNWYINDVLVKSGTDTFTHVFQDTGLYKIDLKPTYPIVGPYFLACFDSAGRKIDVTGAFASFTVEPFDNCGAFQFTNTSFNADQYDWDFGQPTSDDNTSDLENPQHIYTPDFGDFEVCLTVQSNIFCEDIFCDTISSEKRAEFIPYNVFTPNGDGMNDTYAPEVLGVSEFELKIFNRWGELVFESKDPEIEWNGSYLNTGDELPESTYYYIVKYTFECDGAAETLEGIVELIRD
ncbi:T9SS type B sorting domain-containing protein [bacterium]|nr:T9SS type B sorting domain-containing protein [bacterium]